jgi:hypothetical protein
LNNNYPFYCSLSENSYRTDIRMIYTIPIYPHFHTLFYASFFCKVGGCRGKFDIVMVKKKFLLLKMDLFVVIDIKMYIESSFLIKFYKFLFFLFIKLLLHSNEMKFSQLLMSGRNLNIYFLFESKLELLYLAWLLMLI